MALKLYTSVARGLKLTVRQLWGQIPTLVQVTGENLIGGRIFATSPHPE